MPIESLNPATGELLERFDEMSAADVDRSITDAHRAFVDWRRRSFAERADLLRRVARLLREQQAAHARIMALEMGKPIAQGEAEIEKCAVGCEYYAEHAESLLAADPRVTDASRSYVRFDPLGTVLAIMPWNFPYWQVFRFAAPALMAGNTAVLKHASSVPQCALRIEAVFREAGLPEHVFRTLLIGSSAVSRIVAHRDIAAVTLTGSDVAGSRVAEQTGRVLKKTVLELGGSDPFLVLPDADLQAAARTAADARLVNSGQSCIAAKRFIVVEEVADAFVERFRAEMQERRVGSPLDRETQVGPQARVDLRDALHEQVRRSIDAGARPILGAARPEGPGAFYPPTILESVRPGMAAFDEETFGPVAAVIRARDEEEAIALANDSQFGLGASIWTSPDRADRLAPRIQAGSVFFNGMVKSDPRLPFGGIKRSGFGRELAEFGIREFTNVKTVWIA